MTLDISLTLYETADTEDGIVRLDPTDMRTLGIVAGDTIRLEGARKIFVRVQPAFMEDRNQRLARVSPLTAKNLGYLSGQSVRLWGERLKLPIAELVTLQADDDIDQTHIRAREKHLSSFWHEKTVVVDDLLKVPTLDRKPLYAKVVVTQPAGPVIIGHGTEFRIASRQTETDLPQIGSLRDVYRTCQTLVEARFKQIIPDAARSVLLTGPQGCGKSKLVIRLAKEMGVNLRVYDAHQLIDQWLAHQSTELTVSLTEIARRGATIILIDHLEALASWEGQSSALAVAARAVQAQICAMLDELPTQPTLLAFGIVEGEIEGRFRENQRFDLHIPVDAPNRWGRAEILLLATEGKDLAEDVNLTELAAMASGATARDLVHLVTTAALVAEGRRICARDFMTAFRSLVPSAAADVRSDIPMTAWEEVAGLDDIKQMLRETLSWSVLQYDKFAAAGVKPPRSILLSGGQGTGKTSLVRSLASFMPMNYIEVACPILATRQQTDGTQFLRECFALARRKAPCLLFFDDIDVLFEVGVNADIMPHQHPIVAQLMSELDMLSSLPGVMVIAATNRPDRLAPEILRPGRFDFALTLPLPDLAARKKILNIHARKLPLASDIDFDRLAGLTQGMSPAEIATLCNRVGLMALRQSLSAPDGGIMPPVVNAEVFEQALRGRKQ